MVLRQKLLAKWSNGEANTKLCYKKQILGRKFYSCEEFVLWPKSFVKMNRCNIFLYRLLGPRPYCNGTLNYWYVFQPLIFEIYFKRNSVDSVTSQNSSRDLMTISLFLSSCHEKATEALCIGPIHNRLGVALVSKFSV